MMRVLFLLDQLVWFEVAKKVKASGTISVIFSESSESDYHSTKMRLVLSAEAAGWPEDTDTFKVSQSVICLFVKMDGGSGFCDSCSLCAS
jgi:hypothetical protein